MGMLDALKEILSPTRTKFKARILGVTNEQARLVKCLHLLEEPATRVIMASTDDAAEFKQ